MADRVFFRVVAPDGGWNIAHDRASLNRLLLMWRRDKMAYTVYEVAVRDGKPDRVRKVRSWAPVGD